MDNLLFKLAIAQIVFSTVELFGGFVLRSSLITGPFESILLFKKNDKDLFNKHIKIHYFIGGMIFILGIVRELRLMLM